jgi:MoaA/NifB/PqqE/SkfB family radical SAM enzyme
MSLLSILPLSTYKKLENAAAAARPVLSPLKKLSGGRSLFPVAVVAHVTYRCNLDCEMCCQHIPELEVRLPSFPASPGDREGELSPDRWKAIIDDLDRSLPVRPFLHFSGGEPFLYARLLELMAHSRSRGFSTSVITNGWTLAEVAPELVRLGLDRINVSLDGPEEIHDAVRRKATSFRRAVDGIRAVRAAREKAGSKRPLVTINCTVTPRNQGALLEMERVRKESGADALTIEHLIFHDNDKQLAEGIDVPALFDSLDRLEREHGATVYPRIPRRYAETYYKGNTNDLRRGCGLLWTGLRIHPDGTVGPCRGQKMGSLADGTRSVKEIWNNEAYRASRSEIARLGNVPDCARCEHRLY